MTTLATTTNPRTIASESLYACRVEIRTLLNGLFSGMVFTPAEKCRLQALMREMDQIEDLLNS
jgi:hypothetical protein